MAMTSPADVAEASPAPEPTSSSRETQRLEGEKHCEDAGGANVVIQYDLSRRKKLYIFLVLSLVALVQAFDATCVCVTLPVTHSLIQPLFLEYLFTTTAIQSLSNFTVIYLLTPYILDPRRRAQRHRLRKPRPRHDLPSRHHTLPTHIHRNIPRRRPQTRLHRRPHHLHRRQHRLRLCRHSDAATYWEDDPGGWRGWHATPFGGDFDGLVPAAGACEVGVVPEYLVGVGDDCWAVAWGCVFAE